MENLYLPKNLHSLLLDQPYTQDDIGMSGSQILIFSDKVLKIQPETVETQAEYEILAWLQGKLPVPECLYHKVENGISYLLMSRVKGDMSCAKNYMEDPKALTGALAKALRMLWKVDISDCPVQWTLKHKLSEAKDLVERGEVDVENTEPETFGENGFRDPEELLQWLVDHQPEEDLVMSHGDFCLPNIFLEHGHVSGFIDLGRAGVADRWQDIALCYRSLIHNYTGRYSDGVVYEDFRPELLFEALEIEPDWEKLRYYILLDELF